MPEINYKKQERQKELKDLDSKTKSTEWVLNQREKLLSDIETTIDRLDGEYQEKRDTIESMDTEIAAKHSEVEQVNEELTAAADQLAEQQALIAESAGKASQIKDINSIETKKTVTEQNCPCRNPSHDSAEMVELGLRSAACSSLRSSSFPRVLASHDNPTGSFFFFKGTHMSVRTIKQRLLSDPLSAPSIGLAALHWPPSLCSFLCYSAPRAEVRLSVFPYLPDREFL